MEPKKILLIDDDPSLRTAIEAFLKRLNHNVQSCENAEQAVKLLNEKWDLILSDVMMPGISGYDFLKYARKRNPMVPVILMTAYGSIEKAVEAMKIGAYDFLVKPFSLTVLETTITAAFLDRQPVYNTASENSIKPDEDAVRVNIKRISEKFVTSHPKMTEVIETLKKIGPSKATVLIQGESGTGKELIAKMIHEFSPRSQRIFVAINCAAMPDTLLESELFGHEKGSFTGAVARQIGKFELSNNGTILLDEISEMSLTMQTKLLRVLQECEIYRVGGSKSIPLNLRVIATTNRDLFQYTKDGHFREDLYYRINVIRILVPPLRERGDDVIILAQDFLQEFAILHGRNPLLLDEKTKKKMLSYRWPGNIRELRNAMERATLVGDFSVLDEESLVLQPASDEKPESLAESGMTLSEIERQVILSTYHSCGENKTKTAQKLDISLRTLRNKLKSYGIGGDDSEAALEDEAV